MTKLFVTILLAAILFGCQQEKREKLVYTQEDLYETEWDRQEATKFLLDVIEHYETYSAEKYELFGDTYIGYGHKIMDNEDLDYVTEQEASLMALEDLLKYYDKISVEEDKQRLALAALAYNVGITKVLRSKIYRMAKRGINDTTFANEYVKWSYIQGKYREDLRARRVLELDAIGIELSQSIYQRDWRTISDWVVYGE